MDVTEFIPRRKKGETTSYGLEGGTEHLVRVPFRAWACVFVMCPSGLRSMEKCTFGNYNNAMGELMSF
jgi:hypothetical protein